MAQAAMQSVEPPAIDRAHLEAMTFGGPQPRT
jgi:hypothetical protein